LAGNDGDAAGHHFVELFIDVLFLGDFVGGYGAALGVAQSDFLADESGGLGRKFLGEIGLEDGFVGGRRRKVLAGDGVEGAGGAGRFRDAENVGGVTVALVADVGEEADLRVNVDDVGEGGELLARVFVEGLKFFRWRRGFPWGTFASRTAEIAARSY